MTTAASAASDFDPSTTASPAARISAASSRPCRAIHTLCHPSISTAKPRILALNNSWPLPWNSCDMPPVNSATTHAPEHARDNAAGDPAAAACDAGRNRHDDADDQAGLEHLTKDDHQRRQHGYLTMQRSRRERSWHANSWHAVSGRRATSWHDQKTLRRAVEVVEEIIAAGLERPYPHHRFAARRDHFLDV